CSPFATRTWHVGGAPVDRPHAGLWPAESNDAEPGVWPPASGGPHAGRRGPDSSAGSRTAAGTSARSLCASRPASEVFALWHSGRTLAYRGGSPRELRLPRVSPERTRQRSPRALIKTRTRLLPSSLNLHQGTTQGKRLL